MPKTHGTNGYSSSTPVSDGKCVYVLFGTGVAACYDLAGNRKWIKLIQKPVHGYGHSASPLLVGDKLLVHVVDVFAVDTKKGEIHWREKSKLAWGSLVHAKVGNDDVVVTSSGCVIRISDGEVLTRRLPALSYNTPIINGDQVYFIQPNSAVFKLPKDASERINRKPHWQVKLKKDRYYASPVLHQGLIYAVTQRSIFSVIDSTNGSVVYTKNLRLGGKPYPSITLAGNYLYVSSDNGRTVVLKPGREYEEVARNKLETFRSSPVFKGKCLYIRGYKNLYCIGKE
jgi:outer membrane protein assembly factor BamB